MKHAGTRSVAPVRIVAGFTTQLPGRSRRFWQRQFFSSYPRPIQQGAGAPWPRAVDIASIQAPDRQAIVLRSVAFRAYEHSGISADDLAEVPRGRTVGTLGFSFMKGNQGLTDFMTNLPGQSNVAVTYNAVKTGGPVLPISGQGNTMQGTGSATPSAGDGNAAFAAYAMPGDNLIARAHIFRAPSFDLRLFEVTISGWLAEESELEAIIDSLSR